MEYIPLSFLLLSGRARQVAQVRRTTPTLRNRFKKIIVSRGKESISVMLRKMANWASRKQRFGHNPKQLDPQLITNRASNVFLLVMLKAKKLQFVGALLLAAALLLPAG